MQFNRNDVQIAFEAGWDVATIDLAGGSQEARILYVGKEFVTLAGAFFGIEQHIHVAYSEITDLATSHLELLNA